MLIHKFAQRLNFIRQKKETVKLNKIAGRQKRTRRSLFFFSLNISKDLRKRRDAKTTQDKLHARKTEGIKQTQLM